MPHVLHLVLLLLLLAPGAPACVFLREARTVRCHNASLPEVGDALAVLTQLAPNRPAALELEGCRPGGPDHLPSFFGSGAVEEVHQLRVRRCGLRGVDAKALEAVRQGLRHLDLSHNLLRAVPDALRGLRALERLDLQHNRIVFVRPGGALEALPALTALDLAHNRIGLEKEDEEAGANGYRLKGSLPLTDFSLSPGLRSLSLRGNRLAAVPDQVASLPELVSLDLSENVVAQADVLRRTKIRVLDLHANRIQGLRDLPHTLQELDLTDNPLHCDCDVLWLAEWAESSNTSLNLPLCQSPARFKGRQLRAVPWQEECPDEGPAFRYVTQGSGEYDVVEVASNSTSITIAWRVKGSSQDQRAWTVVYRRSADSPSHMTLVPAPAPGADGLIRLSVGRLRPKTAYVLCVALAREGKYAVEPRKCVRSATTAVDVRTQLRRVAAGAASVTLAWRLEAPALNEEEGATYRHEWTIRVRRTGSDNYTDIPVYDITAAEETDGQTYEYGIADLAPRTHYDVCLVDVQHATVHAVGDDNWASATGNATCATVQTLGRSGDALQGGEIAAVVFACGLCVAVCVLTAVLWRRRRRRRPATPSEIFSPPPPLPRAQLSPPAEKTAPRKAVPGAWNTMRLPYTDLGGGRPEFRSFRAVGGGYRDALTSVTIYGSGYSEC